MGAQLAAGVGLSAIDTAVDVMALPGVDRGGLGQEFNQWWDKTTRFENPAYQAVRDLAGVLLPIGYGSKMLTGAVKAGRGTRYKRLSRSLVVSWRWTLHSSVSVTKAQTRTCPSA